jgi:hypothetical protein
VELLHYARVEWLILTKLIMDDALGNTALHLTMKPAARLDQQRSSSRLTGFWAA